MIGKRKEGKEKGLGSLTRVGSVSTGVPGDGWEFRQIAVVDFEKVLGSPLYQTRISLPFSFYHDTGEQWEEGKKRLTKHPLAKTAVSTANAAKPTHPHQPPIGGQSTPDTLKAMRLTSFTSSQALLLLDSRLDGRSGGGFRVDHVGCGRSGEWSQKVLQSEHVILDRWDGLILKGEKDGDYQEGEG
jgi:hypothetical protein